MLFWGLCVVMKVKLDRGWKRVGKIKDPICGIVVTGLWGSVGLLSECSVFSRLYYIAFYLHVHFYP